jgi:hypothetical protein
VAAEKLQKAANKKGAKDSKKSAPKDQPGIIKEPEPVSDVATSKKMAANASKKA